MRVRLTPIETGSQGVVNPGPGAGVSFARIDRHRLLAAVRSMPDCRSAVMTCMVWQACRQERLAQGQYAGQFVARLSGAKLAEMTGRLLRTVRRALSRLIADSQITHRDRAPGKTAVYELAWMK